MKRDGPSLPASGTNGDSDMTAAQLDYAPAPPRRRRWLRRAAAGILLLAVALAGWRWGPGAWTQAQRLYWQRRCLSYRASPEMVVYEEEPRAAAALLASHSAYGAYLLRRGTGGAASGSSGATSAAAHVPVCWVRLTALSPEIRSFAPGPTRAGRGAIVFLHERTSPAGHRRLVCVRYFPPADSFTATFIDGFDVECLAVHPATWSTGPITIPGINAFDVISGFPRRPPNVRVYAGQVDPDDPSHFTVRYQMWGREDTLDGRLDDAGRVTLTPRNPPQPPQD
jgi:hypothetical protein